MDKGTNKMNKQHKQSFADKIGMKKSHVLFKISKYAGEEYHSL